MLDFHIYTFLTVCRFMNYTKAADELNITQPAVSQHISYLETLYETKLFIHEGKKIKLSKSGEFLFKTANALKNDESRILQQLRNLESQDKSFTFGVTMTIGEFAISAPIIKYQKLHKDASIKMIVSNTETLLNKLKMGDIDFALIEGYYDSQKYDNLLFSTEEFIPVCSSNHKFKNMPVYISDVFKENLIIREPGSGSRNILEKNLQLQNLSISNFRKVTEIGSVHSIVEFVKEDCGISFLYKIAVKKEIESGTITELHLKDFNMKHDFKFIWNRESLFSSDYFQICTELKNLSL